MMTSKEDETTTTQQKPLHIAMIMDGNRRFAKRLMKEPWKGHEYGAQKVKDVMKWCKRADIHTLTLFAFSLQNFNRPKKEFDYLMELFKSFFSELKSSNKDITKSGVKITFLGKRELFDKEIQHIIADLEEQTKNNTAYNLQICFGYGGREEIVRAVQSATEDVKQGKLDPKNITEDVLDTYMYSDSKPDIIIRTGGDHRTSNFLSWQSAYSEWFFIDTKWPEFSKEEFEDIIEDFKQRDRRFGK
ncbi:MAG: polyprenyl diphosphate synthase [Nanobdellota archaeon]